MERPFTLNGDFPSVSENFLGHFTPTSPDAGTYDFTNSLLEGECVDTSQGTYKVDFYPYGGEGDIIMTGQVTRTCAGIVVFSDVTESRIAFRPAPTLTCPN